MLLSCGPAVPGFILHRGLQGRKSGLLLLYNKDKDAARILEKTLP